MRPGRGADHPPSSSVEVKERVELYLYSPSGPSWPVIGWPLPLSPVFVLYTHENAHNFLLIVLVHGLMMVTVLQPKPVAAVCICYTTAVLWRMISIDDALQQHHSAATRYNQTRVIVSTPALSAADIMSDSYKQNSEICFLNCYLLCMHYLTMLAITETTQRWMVGDQWTTNRKGNGRKRPGDS